MDSGTRTALISVFRKGGITDFAGELVSLGWQILASGGTCRHLHEAGIEVKDVADLVGGGAILGHRVVTLSREVYAGLLVRDCKEDRDELQRLGIPRIDLVCCDFYPLSDEIAKPGATVESVTEKTDIGGPTMVRAAAKGGRIVICDPADRQVVLDRLRQQGDISSELRQNLRAKAEYLVARYCLDSARFHSQGLYDGLIGRQVAKTAYGENKWQEQAALYSTESDNPLALPRFQTVAGSTPSYNNWVDVERLLQTITHIAAGWNLNYCKVPCIAVAVKHGNACGAAIAPPEDPKVAIEKMVMGDPRAIFGGLVMTNFPIDEELAEVLHTCGLQSGRRIYDGIIAPSFDEKAITMLSRKKDKCRFIVNPALGSLSILECLDAKQRFRPVRGGFLVQPNYTFILNLSDKEMQIFGDRGQEVEPNLLLAWAVGSTSNSNTITLVKDLQLIGNGVAQQDRVGAAQLAQFRALGSHHDTMGAVAYSDSFFPFPDGPAALIAAGVRAIFATSGSINDEKTKAICQAAGVTLYMLPDAVARGFFGH